MKRHCLHTVCHILVCVSVIVRISCCYIPPTAKTSTLLWDLVNYNHEGFTSACSGALPGKKLDPIICSDSTFALKQLVESHQDLVLPRTKNENVDGAKCGKCQLATGPFYRAQPELEPVFLEAFQAVIQSHEQYGISTVLSRYDLFHGHLFRDTNEDHTFLGMLFHCAEYPCFEDNDYGILDGICLGFCQEDSNCYPTLHQWRFRNVLWGAWWNSTQTNNAMQQAVWVLDGKSKELEELQVDSSEFGPDSPNTVFEGFLGEPIADVYHFDHHDSNKANCGIWCTNLAS